MYKENKNDTLMYIGYQRISISVFSYIFNALDIKELFYKKQQDYTLIGSLWSQNSTL